MYKVSNDLKAILVSIVLLLTTTMPLSTNNTAKLDMSIALKLK